MAFTKDQELAMTAGTPTHHADGHTELGHDVLVSASAGSGKTTVLVERILRQILNGGDITRLLVVTFTNAAAAEMKAKIAKALKTELTALTDQITASNDDDQRAELGARRRHLAGQIGLVDSAAISTIDAFALQIVQQYYYVIKLDPGFRVLADQAESMLLQESVWDKLREQLYHDENEAFTALTRNFISGWHDDKLGDLVVRAYTYAQTTTDPRGWLAHLPAVYNPDLSAGSALSKQLAQACAPFVDEAIALLEKAQLFVLQQADAVMATGADSDKTLSLLQGTVAQVKAIKAQLGGDYASLHTAVSDLNWGRWAGAPAKVAKNNPELKDLNKQAQALRDQAKEIITTQVAPLLTLASADLKQALAGSSAIVQEFSHVCQLFMDAYWQEKRRKHALDFADVEQLALRILNSPAAEGGYSVGAIFRDSFDEVLVDEYQDINPLQEALLTAAARNNRFMVGDVKQSIYGFRLAEPQLFMAKYQAFATPDADEATRKAQGEHISLAANFRSRRNILDFTNLIFKQIMDASLGSVNYSGGELLTYGATDYPDEPKPAPTELLISATDDDADATDDDKDQSQVKLVIAKIKALMAGHEQVYERGRNGAEGTWRDLKYQDITLLVPTRSQNLIIQEEFAAAGIPIVVSDAQNYFKTTELQVMLSLLRVIDNPLQEIPLVAVLRSPIVGLSADELALIRIQNKHVAYYDALAEFLNNYDASSATPLATRTYTKTARFMQQLSQFRDIARENRLVDLIWTIYEETGYLDFVGGMPGGAQRQANLHALYERAHTYEEGGFKGLFAFVHFIEVMQERDKDLATPVVISGDTDAVHLMTIHGSKGLQFPYVFLMNASRAFNGGHAGDASVLFSKAGIGMQWLNPETNVVYELPQYSMAKAAQHARDQAENLRVLYVALTRSEQRLFIVGYSKDKEKTIAKWQNMAGGNKLVLPLSSRLGASSQLDLIGAALARHPLFAQRAEASDVLADDHTEFTVHFGQAETQASNVHLAGDDAQSALDVDLTDWLAYQYPHAAATETTGFQSVSEIKQLYADPDIEKLSQSPNSQLQKRQSSAFSVPQFAQNNATTQISATAVGTATHEVLQALDLHAPVTADSVQQTAAQLVVSGLFTQEVAARISVPHVLAFFQTELGKLLLANPDAVQRETPFSMLIPARDIFVGMANEEQDILVHGIIDAYLNLPEQLVLLDYKTDRVPAAGPAAIVDRYRGQLRLYAQALQSMLSRPVDSMSLVLLASGEVVAL